MTVIAYRDGIIAADTKVTAGGALIHKMSKIRMFDNGDAVGFSGNVGIMDYITAAIHAVVKPELENNKAFTYMVVPERGDSFTALYVCAETLRVYYADTLSYGRPFVSCVGTDFVAAGSGLTCAYQAMLGGASAEAAVLQACIIDNDCGKPVHVYDIKTKSLKVIE